MRNYDEDMKRIRFFKDLLSRFDLSGLKRTESLEIVKLAEQLCESNQQTVHYFNKYQKAIDANKKLNRKHSKLKEKFKEHNIKLTEDEEETVQ